METPDFFANPSSMLLASCAVLILGYLLYGGFIARRLGIDPARPTPAHEINDGIDYVPARMPVLLGHHFASIAGAAPIVGPIAAAVFGWLPVLLWILAGGIFAGAVQDMSAIIVSVRHGGRSIGEVIREHVGPTGHRLFLIFSFSALILVIAVFAILVARTFIQSPQAATTSLLFMAIAVLFGIMVQWLRMGILLPTVAGLALVAGSIWGGLEYPMSVYLSTGKLTRAAADILKVPQGKPVLSQLLAAARANPTPGSALKTLEAHFGPLIHEAEERTAKAKVLLGATLKKLDGLKLDLRAKMNEARVDEAAADRLRKAIASLEEESAKNESAAVSLEAGAKKLSFDQKAALGSIRRSQESAFHIWLYFLFAYIFLASVTPVWILLQPRDYLSSFLLYTLIVGAIAGIVISSSPAGLSGAADGQNPRGTADVAEIAMAQPIRINLPAFTAFDQENPGPLFPFLFVIVACGAISGFHSLVASGTTAKQLNSEADARPIGFGGMLIESLLAVIALITAAVLTRENYAAAAGNPVALFANGLGGFLSRTGLPRETAVSFILLAVSAFALTSLDTATRLARFCFQEFFTRYEYDSHGERVKSVFENRFLATGVAVALGAGLAFSGKWQEIWPIFGAANQLLASLALLSISIWLIRSGKGAAPALVPMLLMLTTTLTALVLLTRANIGKSVILAGTSAVLILLAAVLVFHGIGAMRRRGSI